MPQIARYLRTPCELMFAGYCSALIALSGDIEGTNIYWRMHVPLKAFDASLLHVGQTAFFGSNQFRLFFGTWAMMAVVIFVAVRALSSIHAIRLIVFRILGAVTFAGPIHTINYNLSPPDATGPQGWWQWAEIIVAVGFAIFVSSRRGLRLSAAVVVMMVSLHFGFWFLIRWSGSAWYEYLWQLLMLLILPYCTALTWAFWVRKQQGNVSGVSEGKRQ
jgi:hypothetical protein